MSPISTLSEQPQTTARPTLVSVVSQRASGPGAHRIDRRACGDDAGVKEDGKEFDDGVEIEEDDDFLAADGGVFRSDVQDHYKDHDEGGDVHKACRCTRWL
jgi:hypothetical protein